MWKDRYIRGAKAVPEVNAGAVGHKTSARRIPGPMYDTCMSACRWVSKSTYSASAPVSQSSFTGNASWSNTDIGTSSPASCTDVPTGMVGTRYFGAKMAMGPKMTLPAGKWAYQYAPRSFCGANWIENSPGSLRAVRAPGGAPAVTSV